MQLITITGPHPLMSKEWSAANKQDASKERDRERDTDHKTKSGLLATAGYGPSSLNADAEDRHTARRIKVSNIKVKLDFKWFVQYI